MPQKFLKLDLSERVVPLSPKIINAAKKACEGINFYAREGDYMETRKLVTRYAGVKPENVVLADGSYHGLETIFFQFRETDEVIIPVPSFPFYGKYGEYKKFKIKKIPYSTDFKLDIDAVIASIGPKTKAIYIVNPQNPLGSQLSLVEIKKILMAAKKHGVFVVIDEAYYEFGTVTAKNLIGDYSNLIISRSFTKSFGLGGTKLGYIITNPTMAKKLEDIRGPFFGMSRFSLLMARACVADVASTKQHVANIKKAKSQLVKFFKQNDIRYFPSFTNFIAIRLPQAAKIVAGLKNKNILVKNLSDYPDHSGITTDCIRLSIPPLDKLNFFCRTFKAALPKTMALPIKSRAVAAAKVR